MKTRIVLRSGRLSGEFAARQVSVPNTAESAAEALSEVCRRALASPLELPQLSSCAIPGDQVVIALDPEVPGATELVAVIAEQLQGVPDGGVRMTLLLPDDSRHPGWPELLESLPLHLREQMEVVIHRPGDREQLRYLATSAAGERIYLNTRLVDADLIVSLGLIAPDATFGCRGTNSGLFPEFSDTQTREQLTGDLPAVEAGGSSQLRELADEVGWLLGTQFSVQVLPEQSAAPAGILCGAPDAVLAQGRTQALDRCQVRVDTPVETVLLSIPATAGLAWRQLGDALNQASQLVESGGRVIVVADLPEPEGPAANMVRSSQSPEDLIRILRRTPISDSREFLQLLEAEQHARVYLFSRLPVEIVEELGMFPVSEASEIQRLIDSSSGKVVALQNANFALCSVRPPVSGTTTRRKAHRESAE